jgi:hypothetical protein
VDPDKDGHAWDFPAEADLIGEPLLAGDVLVLADVNGRIFGLDRKTGKALGPGYRLKANVAPATAPAAWGADQFFVPLTDGTVLVLPLGRLAPSKG